MESLTLKDLAVKEDVLTSGHRMCAGCTSASAIRMAMKALRGPTIVTVATGCLEVATTILPYTAWRVPWLHSAFENAAATASGIEAAFKALKKRGKAKYEHVDVIAIGGDGGTYDIGFQALSGALERGHDFLYILYDNEAYMNTGIQRSGGTPYCASTTTSPAGSVIPGKPEWKKPIDHIVVEHRAKYVATASPAYPLDLIKKVRKGLEAEGPAFVHILAPCPRGWRFPTEQGIQLARLSVQTCVFPLWEAWWEEDRPVYKLSRPSETIARRPETKKPVEEYLKPQGRFAHLFRPERREDLLRRIQEGVDRDWAILLKKAGLS